MENDTLKSLEERLPELKARMPYGPWQYEPDVFIYTDEYSGYRCEIRRWRIPNPTPKDHSRLEKYQYCLNLLEGIR